MTGQDHRPMEGAPDGRVPSPPMEATPALDPRAAMPGTATTPEPRTAAAPANPPVGDADDRVEMRTGERADK